MGPRSTPEGPQVRQGSPRNAQGGLHEASRIAAAGAHEGPSCGPRDAIEGPQERTVAWPCLGGFPLAAWWESWRDSRGLVVGIPGGTGSGFYETFVKIGTRTHGIPTNLPWESQRLAVGIPAACCGNPRGIPAGLSWKSQRDSRSFAVEFRRDSGQFSHQESHWRRPSAARGVSGKESGGRVGGEACEPQNGLPAQNPAALY